MKKLYQGSMYPLCLIFFLASYLPFLNQEGIIVNGYIFVMIGLSIGQYYFKKSFSSLIRVGLLVGGATLIFSEYQTFWGLEPAVAFLTLLAALKTFELIVARDFFTFVLIIELSLSAHVLTVDAFYMVVYVLATSIGLFALLFTFYRDGVRDPWSKERRKVFIRIFLLSIPLAICLFMLFPRMTLGNFFFNTVKKINRTGFTDQLDPGAISSVIEDKTPYFRAKFYNGKTPSLFELYWRGAILSRTDGFSWKRSKTGVSKEEKVVGPVKFSYLIDYDIFMNAPLFLLDNNLSYEQKSKGYVVNRGGGTFKFFPYSNQKTRYSAKTGQKEVLDLNGSVRASYLELPDRSAFPRFFDWSASLNLKDSSLREKISVFSHYLKTEGFKYSLSPGQIRGSKPLDQFFFDKKVGLCGHFASSLGVFLRTQGVPARLVSGFHGGKLNPMGDYFLVTGQDAHAWVEAWDDKKGWKRVDPTNWVAPERIRFGSDAYFAPGRDQLSEPLDIFLQRQNSQFFKKISFALDMFYYEMNREFIGFDKERQKELFSFLGVDKKFWPWKLTLLLGSIITIFLLLLSYWSFLKRSAVNEVDTLFSKYEKLLSKFGLNRDTSEGPLDYLARCQRHVPSSSEVLKEFTTLYVCAKYGEDSTNFTALKRCLSNVKKSLKKD